MCVSVSKTKGLSLSFKNLKAILKSALTHTTDLHGLEMGKKEESKPFICFLIWLFLWFEMGFPSGSVVKNPPADVGDARHLGLIPGPGRSPGGGNGNPLQYSCQDKTEEPGDYSPWVCKESDMMECECAHAHTHIHTVSEKNFKM